MWEDFWKHNGSPNRIRTYDPTVNSRLLYHWATEEYNNVVWPVTLTVNPPRRTLALKLSQEYIFPEEKARVYYGKRSECQKKFQKRIYAVFYGSSRPFFWQNPHFEYIG